MTKKKRKKKEYKRYLDYNATKILCRYCEAKDNCKMKIRKEKIEEEGIMTYCLFVPNKQSKIPKTIKVDKNGKIININKNGISINKTFAEEKSVDKSENKKYNKSYRKYKKDEN